MHPNKLYSLILIGGLVLCVTFPIDTSAAPQIKYLFNRADYVTGSGPSSVAVADFNGDGIQDSVTANQYDDTLSVFLGTTTGVFQAKVDFATAPSPYSLALGDFNGDGKVDIAVATTSGSISVLLGNGDGTFAAHVDYPVSNSLVGIVSGDFNRDGKTDLGVIAWCGQGCGVIAVLFGNGDGTFQSATDYPVGNQPNGLVAEDFNGDGILDLASGNSNGISVLLGKGDGTFAAAIDTPTSWQVLAIVAADFDRDGVIDIALCFGTGPTGVAFFKGNGDGTFQARQQLTTFLPAGTMGAADVNQDGKLDLLFTSVFQGGVGVFLGNGDGTFSPELIFASGIYPNGLDIRDVNGDGNVDLLVTDQQDSRLTVLLGNGDGTFSPRTNLPSPPASQFPLSTNAAIARDFNGDGAPDLALANGSIGYGTGVVSVLLNQGHGTAATSIDSNSNGAFSSIVAADFNNDGHLDVALGNGNGAAVMLGLGNGSFASPLQAVFTQATPARSLVTGDFNNDGNQDLVVVANGFLQTQPIYVLLGKGDGTFMPPVRLWNSTSVPDLVAAADFNLDGKLDLVVTINPNGVGVMLGNGDGTFQNPVIYATDNLPSGLTVADLNADGIPDLVAVGSLIDVFLGKGDGTFPARVDYNGGNFPGQITAADIDQDGKIDLVAAAQGRTTGALEILRGNGDGTFQMPVEFASSSFFGPLTTADINQDGTPDIITVGLPGSIFLSGPLTTVAPGALNFGVVGIANTTPPQQVYVVNSGNSPLHLSALNASSGFSIGTGCGSISPSSSCAIDVTFTPTSSGTISGLLSISDDAPGHHRSVLLSGTGVTPFSMTATSANISLQPGTRATNVIALSGLLAAAGTPVQLTCSIVGPTPAPTCSLSPSSLPTNVDSGTATLSITAPTSTAGFQRKPKVVSQLRFALWLPLLLAIGYFGGTRKRGKHSALLCIIFTAFVLFNACGGGSSGGNSSSGGGNAPPPTIYTVTVTATAGLIQNSLKLTVTVGH